MLTLSRLCILSFCYLFFVCQDIIGYFLEKYLVFLQQGPPVRPEDEWPLVWVTSNTWSIANTPIHCDGYGDYDDHDWVDANVSGICQLGTPTHNLGLHKEHQQWSKFAKKNNQDWPKGCQNRPKFCVLFAKKYTTAGCGGCDKYQLFANDRNAPFCVQKKITQSHSTLDLGPWLIILDPFSGQKRSCKRPKLDPSGPSSKSICPYEFCCW